VRAIAESIRFDAGLQAAKALIDACVLEWIEHAHPEIVVLIQDAFQPDQEGNLSVFKIRAVQRHAFEDEHWRRAIEAIDKPCTWWVARATSVYMSESVMPTATIPLPLILRGGG